MELIEEFRVAGLPNSLYVQYMTEVDARITEATPEALRIPTRYELYKAALNALNAAYKRQVKNNLTESLEEKDKERDDDYRCFYAHAKADLYNHDPEIRESAKRIVNKIETYGNLAKSSRRAQSGDMTNLGKALSTEPLSADVEKIGQTTNLNNMIAANNAYIELDRERSASKKSIVLNATREAREALDEQYRIVVSAINAQVMMNAYVDEATQPSEPGQPEVQAAQTTAEVLADFVRSMNVLIKEFKTEAEQLGSDKNPDDSTPTPETPDKEEEDDTTTETPENPDEGQGETPETPSEGEGETETPEEPDDRPVVQ